MTRRAGRSVQELERWFGFGSLRPDPADPETGQSLQQRIVEAAMAGRDVLAILPTGAGKSLCYQLPALSRYDKTGALTGVISPLVLCLTATAKPEVKNQICEYFGRHRGTEMRLFDGGSRRTILDFTVSSTTAAMKLHDVEMTLEHHLPQHLPGGAIIYCATRRGTSEVAEFLQAQGVDADRFHAGLQPEEKKLIQQRFIDGELRVIAATNAFGMGIDKPDVRLVIHAEIPSSLENYLQEAGRAGRDQQQAHCVLLYTEDEADDFTSECASRPATVSPRPPEWRRR